MKIIIFFLLIFILLIHLQNTRLLNNLQKNNMSQKSIITITTQLLLILRQQLQHILKIKTASKIVQLLVQEQQLLEPPNIKLKKHLAISSV